MRVDGCHVLSALLPLRAVETVGKCAMSAGAGYPNVTVVVPNYNCGKYLPEALESIFRIQGLEVNVVVVDDASTDISRKMLACRLGLPQTVKTILLDGNHGGPSAPRNIGLRFATGKYVCFLDADDVLVDGAMEEAVAFHESHPGLGLVFSDVIKFDDAKGEWPRPFLTEYSHFREMDKKRVGRDWFVIEGRRAYDALFYENFLATGACVVPRVVFHEVGEFDETLSNGDDWDMWFRITRTYDVGFIDRVGLRYRVRNGSISCRGARLAENRIRVVKKQLEFADLSAAVRKRASRLIAENLYAIGYHHQSTGNMAKARAQYFASLREHLSWSAAKGLAIALAGNRFYSGLKRIKKARLGCNRFRSCPRINAKRERG